MPLFRRRSWTPDEIPDLRFRDDRLSVDIGFLGGDEHRGAFTQIFAKMVRDNAATLAGMKLVAIESTKPVSPSALGVGGLPVDLSAIDLSSFASGLYDRHAEKIVLRLVGPRGPALLGVRFDDPEFWFEEAAA
jgi:hypothetical protein